MIIHQNHTNKGFSLLELLLVVGIFSILVAYASSIYDSWYRDSVDRKAAREILYLQNAAESYVTLNFNDVLPPLNTTAEINILDLIAQNALPADFNNVNSHKQRMRVFIRHATNSAVNGSVIDVLTVTDNQSLTNIQRISNDRLFKVAETFPELGIISNVTIGTDCCNGNVQSLKGLWRIPLSDISSLYTTTANSDGGYLAAYGRVSIDEDIISNYLYRVPIPLIPNANTMEANLDMGGNDILNSNAIISDGLIVQGNATFDGNSSQLNAPYVLMTTENVTFNQNVSVEANGGERGNVVIAGDNGVGTDFSILGTLTVQLDEDTTGGVVSSREMSADIINPLGPVNLRNANLNNASLQAGNIYSRETRYNNSITTNNMQAIQINNINSMTGANLVSEQTLVNTNLNAPANFNADNAMNIVGNANVTGAMNISDEATIYDLNCANPTGCPQ